MTVYRDNVPTQRPEAEVLEPDVLQSGEAIIACSDFGIRGDFSHGTLLTDRSLSTWDPEWFGTFELAKIEALEAGFRTNAAGHLKFVYEDETVTVVLPREKGYFHLVLEAIPESGYRKGTAQIKAMEAIVLLQQGHQPRGFLEVEFARVRNRRLNAILDRLPAGRTSVLAEAARVNGDKGELYIYPTHMVFACVGQGPAEKVVGQALGYGLWGLPINLIRPKSNVALFKWNEILWLARVYVMNLRKVLVFLCGDSVLHGRNLFVLDISEHSTDWLDAIAEHVEVDNFRFSI